MKTVYFLSGLPRSGSTLLGSILSQHPDIYVTPTSPLLDILCATNDTLTKCKVSYTYDKNIDDKLYTSIAATYYSQYHQQVIIDKHRGWPRNVEPARLCITKDPKIICTYRPIPEVIASYLKLISSQPGDNFIDAGLKKLNRPLTIENRSDILWSSYISDPYNSLIHGLDQYRDNLFLVYYDDLMADPELILSKIYEFLNIAPHCHDFNRIDNACAEDKDEAWGLKGLHDIRPILKKTSTPAVDILGSYLVRKYNRYNIIL